MTESPVAGDRRARRTRRALFGQPGQARRSGIPWLLGVPLAFLVVVLIVPLVVMAVTAVREKGLSGSVSVLGNPDFLAAFRRTLVLASAVSALTLVAAVLFSLALALSSRAVRVVLFTALFLSFTVSVLVRTYGWVLLFQPNGALDQLGRSLGIIDDSFNLLQTNLALYPAMVHAMLPIMVLPIYASLRGIDPNQFRAAQSLGASPWLTLRSVVLPQLKSGAAAGVTLVFALSLGFFITPQLLGGPHNVLLPTLIYREFDVLLDIGTASAMSVFLLALVLILLFTADRVLKVTRQWEAR